MITGLSIIVTMHISIIFLCIWHMRYFDGASYLLIYHSLVSAGFRFFLFNLPNDLTYLVHIRSCLLAVSLISNMVVVATYYINFVK